MRTFNIQFTEQQLDIIGNLLGDAPFRVAAPIVSAINHQIAEQQRLIAEAEPKQEQGSAT